MSAVVASGPLITAGRPASRSRVLPISLAREIALVAYFGTGFLYYLQQIPAGHLINLAFLFVFGLLGAASPGRLVLGRTELLHVVVITGIAIAALLGVVVRGGSLLTDTGRALTWFVPALALLMIAKAPDLRLGLVCRWICGINLACNLVITVLFARFNANLAKFEVQTPWFDLSSNELSYHLVAFGILFALLGSYPRPSRTGWWLALASFGHLSKAHLAAAAVATVAAILRGRMILTSLLLLLAVLLVRWSAPVLEGAELPVPDSLVAVAGRLRDLLLLSVQWLSGGWIATDALAEAVGGSRFLVYTAAADLVGQAPFGLSQARVDQFLLGLDPHSNFIYLLLREGWLVGAGYLVVSVLSVWSVPVRSVGQRTLYAVLLYVLIRTLFLTYDPVKVVTLLLFASCIMRRSGPGAQELS